MSEGGFAQWMTAGARFTAAHLVYLREEKGEPTDRPLRKTLCGKTEKVDWKPVIPADQAKCMSCDRNGAKRAVTIVDPTGRE
jgi:hypothetical protein